MRPSSFLFAILILSCPAFAQTGEVRSGIEVLEARRFDVLRGQKVGLVTNQTGLTRDGRATIDILHAAPDVQLVALFAPEHGVRGTVAAGKSVGTSRDAKTGLPIYSLYGKTRKPTAGMLRGVQTLVLDIQSIGSRSYTFIATMGEAMEACAERRIRFVVLDRPNPLGDASEGNIAQKFSFVGPYPIPYRYGLTMGELARWLNAKRGHSCQLTIVPMQNYRRGMVWSETGLGWTPSSPNIPRGDSAFYYGATGILGELPALSIGIGTPLPFELAGAPGLNAYALKNALDARKLAGWEFRAVSWKPSKSLYAGRLCTGVQIVLTDAKRAQTTRLNFEIYRAVRKIAPTLSFFGSKRHNAMFDLVCGTNQIRALMQSGKSADQLWAAWNRGRINWEKEAQAARIYR